MIYEGREKRSDVMGDEMCTILMEVREVFTSSYSVSLIPPL